MTRAAISSSSAMVFDLVLLLGSNNERSGWRCCGWQSERGLVGSGRLVFVRGFSAGADPESSTLELVLSSLLALGSRFFPAGKAVSHKTHQF